MNTLTVNPDWAKLPLFDRTKWQRVRFGDVVENINETVRNPTGPGIERFIGLEHLEPGSLHIRVWGNVADGTTFTRRCRPGQVLFGKRRAYQRKVAVAEFDAVVSGDIYVFAPKNERLLPELLPFLCMSERFFQHAVDTSAGSLSPHTNWNSLAGFEFDLPPLDQQRRIADILWAVDEYGKIASEVAESVQFTIEPMLARLLSVGLRETSLQETEIGFLPATWSLCHLRDLVSVKEHALLAGLFGTIFKAKDFRAEGVRIIQLRHVSEEGFLWGENETYMDMEVYERIHKPYTVRPGDLLITKMGEPPGIACLYPAGGPLAMVTPDVIKATIDESVADVRFVKHLYNSRVMRTQVTRLIKGATRPRVSLNEFFRLSLPLPPLEEQKEIAEIADSFVSCGTAAKHSAIDSSGLRMELFGLLDALVHSCQE